MSAQSVVDPVSPQRTADALQRCRARQAEWQVQSVRARLVPIRELRRLLVRECDALCDAVKADVGKAPQETIGCEILPLADACRFLERQARALLKPRKVPRRSRPLWMLGQRDVVHRRPRGVVGVIGTWNYPLMLNGAQIAQALTAGNGVLWKPSEVAPRSTTVLADLLHRAGFPADLLQIMEATREGGAALVEADVDHVVFTGGASTGKIIARRLGERLISSTLELSGCDASFVLEDANVDLAAAGIWFGTTLNRGQTCISVRRALVHQSVLPALIEKLKTLAQGAAPMRLALASQVEQAERLIRDAVTRGARVLNGAAAATSPTEQHPTVVTDVSPDASLCTEASFAPLLAVLSFDTLDQAIEMDRRCSYALGASIFTRDLAKARGLAEQLDAGCVTINDVIAPTAHPAVPFGGNRESGWGVTQGAEGLLEMTVPQVVSERGGSDRPHYHLAPGSGVDQRELLRGMLEMTHGNSIGQKWRGLWKLIRGMREMRAAEKSKI